MKSSFFLIVLVAVASCCEPLQAQSSPKPIKALLITGGCCHDYTQQKKILPEAVSARARVDWTIVHQGGSATDARIPFYENPEWYKGFDIVVHNECFANIPDPVWTAGILKAHREGVPAVVVHCAMHCYRDKTDEWFKFLGVTSRRHGANYPFDVVNIAKDDPIMEGFGEKWSTPKGELYIIEKLWPTAKPLAHARSRDTMKDEVCIWTNEYNKTRVFGTTIGHHNEEMNDPVFQEYVTRGLLWACDKLNADYLQPHKDARYEHVPDPKAKLVPMKSGEPTPAKPAARGIEKVLAPVNLAKGKPAAASSFERKNNQDNDAAKAVDEDPATRWCADGGTVPQWWQVDLGKPETLTGCKIVFEFGERKYQYLVEGSADAKTWKTLSDQQQNESLEQVREHKFDAEEIRFVRITITGLAPACWACFWEVEVHGKDLVEKTMSVTPKPRSIVATPEKSILAGVKVLPGYDVTLFAAPPQIGYPVCLAAAPTGEVFVGVDENGSLDAKPGRGRVVRCADRDGDGAADEFKVFAQMDSPRGIVADGNTIYVQHPPHVTAFHDDNGDGVSDREERLVEGLGFDLKFRGADHTTNGMTLGIDGWLYIAVGDYGFIRAKDKAGATRQLHGGGVVRVRTDGTGLEIVSRGQRNIYDVAVSPMLDLFTRDNTNDGGGWNVRLSHVIPTGHYGYPSLFTNFPDEIVQPLADYGGGSPCGSLWIDDPRLGPEFGNALYTCDWGRSVVYRHPLATNGAGFKAEQVPFVELPRPTDMDIDGLGRIYISSWKDGGFNYSGPNVGYVVRVSNQDAPAANFPNLQTATDAELLTYLTTGGHVLRLATQSELLRRQAATSGRGSDNKAATSGRGLTLSELEKSAQSPDVSLPARVAAIFTLKQLAGADSHSFLVKLAADDTLREFALRALADDVRLVAEVPLAPFVAALTDPNPRIRLQAAVGLGRLSATAEAAKLAPLVADQDPHVAHAAVNSLVTLKASGPCLAQLENGPSEAIAGSVRVLQSLHDPEVVQGLVAILGKVTDPARRRGTLVALCRLAHREADWDGKWWGTRPDTSGPYFKSVAWEKTEEILAVLRSELAGADAETARWLLTQLKRHKVNLGDQTPLILKLAAENAAFQPTAVDLISAELKPAGEGLAFLQMVAADPQADAALRAKAIRALMAGDLTIAIAALDAAAIDDPDHPLAQARLDFAKHPSRSGQLDTFLKLTAESTPTRRELAYLVLLALETGKAAAGVKQQAKGTISQAWAQPEQAASLLRAIGQLRAEDYVVPVSAQLNSLNPQIKAAAAYAAEQLAIDLSPIGDSANRVTIATQPLDAVQAAAASAKGDAKLGQRLFARQSCINCHTVLPGETPKGPFLGGIATRYKRSELVESILKPSVKIAQGFETQKFLLLDGRTLEGFVSREAGDEVEVRDNKGVVTLIKPDDIEQRGKSEISMMPLGLCDKLTLQELSSLLVYLESLPAK